MAFRVDGTNSSWWQTHDPDGNVTFAAGQTLTRSDCRASRQAEYVKNPPGGEPGGFFTYDRSRSVGSEAQVVPADLRISEECGKCRPADDVGAALRALAVPHGNDVREIGRDLNSAAVLGAEGGLTPRGSRQVDHELLQLISELLQIERGVVGVQRRVASAGEGLDVVADGLRGRHLLDRVVGLYVDNAGLRVWQVEDVDHGMHAGRRAVDEPLHAQLDVGPGAELDELHNLLAPVRLRPPPVHQRRFGDHRDQLGRGAIGPVKDLLPDLPGFHHPAPPGGRPRANPHHGFGVGGRLHQAGQQERHEYPDPDRVVLEPGELVLEDRGVLPPPGPCPGPDGQLLEFGAFLFADAVDPQEVPDVAHLGALPVVGLEPAHLAPAPVEQVAYVVGGVPGGAPQLGEAAG